MFIARIICAHREALAIIKNDYPNANSTHKSYMIYGANEVALAMWREYRIDRPCTKGIDSQYINFARQLDINRLTEFGVSDRFNPRIPDELDDQALGMFEALRW